MNITVWIMSIAGISILTLLADVLLPEGETAKYIKGVLAIFIVFAIVSPLPALFSSETGLSDFLMSGDATTVDYGYIDYSNRLKQAYLEYEITEYLAENGISGAKISVIAEFDVNIMTVKAISADLSKAVVSPSATENLNQRVIELINGATGVKKENITVYG